MLDFKKMKNEGEWLQVETDEWFVAPDGQSYKGVWGVCKIIEAENLLGLTPANATNWYLQVGTTEETMMFIAGCRVHYAHICLTEPKSTNIYKLR